MIDLNVRFSILETIKNKVKILPGIITYPIFLRDLKFQVSDNHNCLQVSFNYTVDFVFLQENIMAAINDDIVANKVEFNVMETGRPAECYPSNVTIHAYMEIM